METEVDTYILNKYGIKIFEGYKNGNVLLNDKHLDKMIEEYYRKTLVAGKRIFKIQVGNLSTEEIDIFLSQIKINMEIQNSMASSTRQKTLVVSHENRKQ